MLPNSRLAAQAAPMQPIRAPGHWLPFQGRKLKGDCLRGVVPEGVMALIDRKAAIRPGDLVMFRLKWKLDPFGGPMVKRFVEVHRGEMVFETTFPQLETWSLPIAALSYAYRVRRYVAGLADLPRAIRELQRDETLHNEPLGWRMVHPPHSLRTGEMEAV